MITNTNIRDRYKFIYDIQKEKHIRSKGVEFITKAKHSKTNSIFYLFEWSDEYQKVADEDTRADGTPQLSVVSFLFIRKMNYKRENTK